MSKKIAAIVTAALSVTGVVMAAASPALAGGGVIPLEDVAPILSTTQTTADLPPTYIDLHVLGDIDPASVRAIGHDEVADYWVGQSTANDICLITAIRGGNEVAGSSCRSLVEFNQFGLAMITGEDASDPKRSAEAYYLPGDVTLSDVGATESNGSNLRVAEGANSSQPMDGLAAGRPGTLDLEARDVERSNGSTFHFKPLSIPTNGFTK